MLIYQSMKNKYKLLIDSSELFHKPFYVDWEKIV